ncbi:hypothetical protein [Coxiella burnetii]|uniref:Uncharacterized protein n=2 Tax=Coxiella burnetii TaxID=777 RepID=B5QS71_COXBU|nr:hypothetical protein [Coxiella burnetii]YP_002332943.1 hypothetical protein CBU_0065a [Coxiella burnetii RSA 493]ABS78305.1 hypothetical protein CBUD_2039 [Coxiella burnetii Dugway 5J108-111]ACI15234.1 hypothetical protein CBU_0065a [Coxiella burnetii RSA 493]ACJ19193.1 hypothetical protein CbuG_1948 [Coxiella burnetii CbuG_Q212]ACJ21110.1 hypothetical protein CbuK_2008 [Coxiella burnetii CbuK_Q154]AIT64183.1 Putative membrane protein [Coxiella burnetii str. Namibia]
MDKTPSCKRRASPWVIALFIILLVVAGWYLLFPVLGLTLAVTAGVWGVIIATIVVLSIAILFFLVFSGVGVIILAVFAFLWGLLAIILFPIIFPVVVPLLIVLLFIGFLLRRKR